MNITAKEIKQIIIEETTKVLEAYELTDLSPNYGSEMTDQERMMDQWTTDVTKDLFDSILTGGNISLPTGESENLDGFLAALGNMAITGGVSGKEALAMVRELGAAAEAAMSKASRTFVDEDYIEDKKWESGEYDHLLDQGELTEKLDPETHDLGDYTSDFKKSKAPQFQGKSDKKKEKMAQAAYFGAKRGD